MLEKIFLMGAPPLVTETGTYIPFLVLLSYVVASLASYTALDLAIHISRTRNRVHQRLWHYSGSFAMGAGIWSMHFIGMLAYKMDMLVNYNPYITALSAMPAIIVSYFVLHIVESGKISFFRILFSAVLLGFGICAMHYTGMAAMEMDGDILYKPGLFALSVLIAIAASGAALLIAFMLTYRATKYQFILKILAALIMGVAICGMHYTGMAATIFVPWADCRYDPEQSYIGLAVSIAQVTLAILFIAIFLRIYLKKETEEREVSSFKARLSVVFIFYFFIFCILTGSVYYFGNKNISDLLEKHRTQYRADASQVAKEIEDTFLLLYQNMRTIGRLPSVRSIDRHATNLSRSDRIAIQELYNNMSDNVSVSEVYIVPQDFNPERIDSFTGKPEEPIMMFDNYITGHVKADARGGGDVTEEIEIYEYRLLRKQLSWLRQRYGVLDTSPDFEVPAISGEEVITCDNTRYDPANPDDADRSGLVYSVPFYSMEGGLRGTISSIILSNALRDLFDKPYFSLQNKAYGYQILPYDNNSQPHRSKKWLDQGKKDPDLLFSEVIPLSIKDKDGPWLLWVGVPDSVLTESREYIAVRRYQNMAYVAIFIIFLTSITMFHREHHNYLLMRRAKEALGQEKSYLSAILNHMMQGVVTIDENGTIETFNKWAESVFGYSAVEVIGKNVNILMPEPYHSQHDQYMKNYLETGNAKIIGFGREVEGKKKDGRVFPLHLSVTEIRADSGSVFVGLVSDITEQKEKERKLKHAKQEADQANAAKSDFLANMSHELRTPLNSIIGMTRMLVEDLDVDGDNRDMAGTAYKSAVNLLDIVNDILDISKIESGNMTLETIGFDFKDMVANVMEAMAPIASEKGISLKYQYESDDIPYLVGDPLRVSRILTNLVGNAIKYTDKGGIDVTIDMKSLSSEDADIRILDVQDGDVRVSVESKALKGGRIEIYCEVSDSGIGIPENKLSTIFEKFSQADISTTRKYGGTGLGLAITKDLVEMMGGTIGVMSTVGKGSTFWFRIPFEPTDKLDEDMQNKTGNGEARSKAGATLNVKDVRILVAEDHLLNQDFIGRLLQRMGFEDYEIVENGVLAVDSFEQGDYNLILMDCHMPEKNGYEATEAIRHSKKEAGKTVPIIALTADAMKGTRQKTFKAGMNDYVSKPIDAAELKDVLAQWVVFPGDDGGQEGAVKTQEHHAPVDMSLLQDYADTPEDVKNFAEVFLKQSVESIKTLKKNCVDGENKDWVDAAHKLKGGAGMVGARDLYALCEQTQSMNPATAKEREDIAAKICAEYEIVKKYLHDTLA